MGAGRGGGRSRSRPPPQPRLRLRGARALPPFVAPRGSVRSQTYKNLKTWLSPNSGKLPQFRRDASSGEGDQWRRAAPTTARTSNVAGSRRAPLPSPDGPAPAHPGPPRLRFRPPPCGCPGSPAAAAFVVSLSGPGDATGCQGARARAQLPLALPADTAAPPRGDAPPRPHPSRLRPPGRLPSPGAAGNGAPAARGRRNTRNSCTQLHLSRPRNLPRGQRDPARPAARTCGPARGARLPLQPSPRSRLRPRGQVRGGPHPTLPRPPWRQVRAGAWAHADHFPPPSPLRPASRWVRGRYLPARGGSEWRGSGFSPAPCPLRPAQIPGPPSPSAPVPLPVVVWGPSGARRCRIPSVPGEVHSAGGWLTWVLFTHRSDPKGTCSPVLTPVGPHSDATESQEWQQPQVNGSNRGGMYEWILPPLNPSSFSWLIVYPL